MVLLPLQIIVNDNIINYVSHLHSCYSLLSTALIITFIKMEKKPRKKF